MGNLGEVRIGKHHTTHKKRAIKIFSKRLMQKSQVSRVHYEIQLMKSFDHPNICKVYEYFEDDTRIYLVMELLSGGSLRDRIVKRKRSHFEEEEVASVIQQVL